MSNQLKSHLVGHSFGLDSLDSSGVSFLNLLITEALGLGKIYFMAMNYISGLIAIMGRLGRNRIEIK